MLSNKVDLPASFGPWIRILPRWGKCRLISRKSLNRSTVRCLRIIMYFYSKGELPSRLSAYPQGTWAAQASPLLSRPYASRPYAGGEGSPRCSGGRSTIPLWWPARLFVPARQEQQRSIRLQGRSVLHGEKGVRLSEKRSYPRQ